MLNRFRKDKTYGKISLASKWCPTVGSSYDKRTLLCEGIGRRLLAQEAKHTDFVRWDELRLG